MSDLISFSLKNFRIFEQLTEFQVAPITLITGPNSSGKSSLTKAILLFKENLSNTILCEELEPKQSVKSLGTFKNLIHKKSKSDILEFQYKMEIPFIKYTIKQTNNIFKHAIVKVVIKFKEQPRLPVIFLKDRPASVKPLFDPPGIFLDCKIFDSDDILLFSIERTDDYDSKSNQFMYYSTINIDIIFQEMDKENDLEPILLFDYFDAFENIISVEQMVKAERDLLINYFTNFKSNPNDLNQHVDVLDLEDQFDSSLIHDEIAREINNYNVPFVSKCEVNQNFDLFYSISKYIYKSILEDNPFKNVDYIPAERSYLSRSYSNNSSFLLTDIINQLKNSQRYIDSDFLSKWLRIFGIGDYIDIKIDDGSIAKIYIIKDENKTLLADLGYGITQFLPIILICSMTEGNLLENETIVIEEPELNLHPRYQSLLADLFFDAHKTFHKRFIIETHSEYIIRKFQYLVGSKMLSSEDIVIHYMPDLEASVLTEEIKHIKILEDGSLSDNFGKGFYDEAIHWQLELLHLKNKN